MAKKTKEIISPLESNFGAERAVWKNEFWTEFLTSIGPYLYNPQLYALQNHKKTNDIADVVIFAKTVTLSLLKVDL